MAHVLTFLPLLPPQARAGLRSRKNGAFLHILNGVRCSAPPPEGSHMMGVCLEIHLRAPTAPCLPPGGVNGTQGCLASQAPRLLTPGHS